MFSASAPHQERSARGRQGCAAAASETGRVARSLTAISLGTRRPSSISLERLASSGEEITESLEQSRRLGCRLLRGGRVDALTRRLDIFCDHIFCDQECLLETIGDAIASLRRQVMQNACYCVVTKTAQFVTDEMSEFVLALQKLWRDRPIGSSMLRATFAPIQRRSARGCINFSLRRAQHRNFLGSRRGYHSIAPSFRFQRTKVHNFASSSKLKLNG